jgi:hypothetical protein
MGHQIIVSVYKGKELFTSAWRAIEKMLTIMRKSRVLVAIEENIIK